jgi:class 3 adenylate cyclase
MRALWEEDWHTYTETAIGTYFQWKHADRASEIAELYRAGATQESLQAVVGALRDVDVSPRLPSVLAPTLVVTTDGYFVDLRDETRRLAAGLPNAEVKIVPGETGFFDFYDAEDNLVTAVNGFLGGPALAESSSGPRAGDAAHAGVVRTVLFTDIVGHTEMMQRLGDTKGRDLLREHERITRETLVHHGGVEVKTMGDGFMTSFASVTNAIECAIALQRAFAERAPSMPEPLHVRVGLNAGEPIEEDGDLFGSTVILASRIAARADADEILVPDHVRGLLSGKSISFRDRGEFTPKGFDESVRLSEVLWRD